MMRSVMCSVKSPSPRVRGHPFQNEKSWIGAGLSPRMRGHLFSSNLDQAKERSIPACAGPPTPSCWATSRSRVYPRVCGATSFGREWRMKQEGLSPRVRGHRGRVACQNGCTGSIPACAGPPARALAPATTSWVYPRVCGATGPSSGARNYVVGLSPRVRGHLWPDDYDPRWGRSIPACAGPPACRSAPKPKGLSPRVRGHPCADMAQGKSQESVYQRTSESATSNFCQSGRRMIISGVRNKASDRRRQALVSQLRYIPRFRRCRAPLSSCARKPDPLVRQTPSPTSPRNA